MTQPTTVKSPEPRASRPRVSVGVAIQQAFELLCIVRVERVERGLASVGLEPGFADVLAARLDRARRAQAAYAAKRGKRAETRRLAELEARAESLRREIADAARWHLRHRPGDLVPFRAPRRGRESLAHALFNLATALESRAGLFALDPRFDPAAQAAEARRVARDLSEAISESRQDTERPRLRAERDRAFAELNATVREIRAAGRYVFRGEPRLARHFTSAPRRRRRRAR